MGIKKNVKVIRLTESDLVNIVKKVLNEESGVLEAKPFKNPPPASLTNVFSDEELVKILGWAKRWNNEELHGGDGVGRYLSKEIIKVGGDSALLRSLVGWIKDEYQFKNYIFWFYNEVNENHPEYEYYWTGPIKSELSFLPPSTEVDKEDDSFLNKIRKAFR
tara:strand:+ start:528 stop:1013 length:486 start_codon:yes stop_codon:yes gene_type:complete